MSTDFSLEELPSWTELEFATDSGVTPIGVSSDACFLFRGNENYLKRLKEVSDQALFDLMRDEIQALASRWLQIEHVAVVLGAGASYYVTGMLGRDILSEVSQLLEDRPSKATLDKVLEHVPDIEVAANDFESFLSQLSVVVNLEDPSHGPITGLKPAEILGCSKAELESLLSDIERAIALIFGSRLPQSIFSPQDDTEKSLFLTPHEALILKLVARDAQLPRVSIFTTNYDTLLEQAMDRLAVLYQDGFSGTVDRRFNPATYALDYYYPGEVTQGRVQRYDKVLHLHKLHGSVSWRHKEGRETNPFNIRFASVNVSPETDLDSLFDPDQALVILPTSSKYGETLGMPFAHLFRSFHQALSRPQTLLLVLGYSGWDEHVNAMIVDALTNPGFGLVLVDPSPSKWARQLAQADAAGRVYLMGGPWATMEFFATSVLPDLESMTTRMAVGRTLEQLRQGGTPAREARTGTSELGTSEEANSTAHGVGEEESDGVI